MHLLFQILFESTSEESSVEDDEQDAATGSQNKDKDGLLDLEDLGPMMKTMKKAKVRSLLVMV